MFNREALRKARHDRVRKKIRGVSDRPRLNVYRSLNNIYAQVIDDEKGVTIVSASTLEPELKQAGKSGGNIEAAKQVGHLVAVRALEKGVSKVTFDRGDRKSVV